MKKKIVINENHSDKKPEKFMAFFTVSEDYKIALELNKLLKISLSFDSELSERNHFLSVFSFTNENFEKFILLKTSPEIRALSKKTKNLDFFFFILSYNSNPLSDYFEIIMKNAKIQGRFIIEPDKEILKIIKSLF